MSIKVTFGELMSASSQISSAHNKISGELEALEGRVKNVLAGYDGESSEAYNNAQREWDTAASDLAQVLSSIGVAVQQAAEAYQEGERRNASRWG
ncbi:early secretory antigenic target ESAT-6 [Lentzea xinjiangensis]|uniref:ESAT-6-like protein n=1 Tax=Lentzea xinjiangensis TaxID=402600 RepID=A0A1H9BKV0_9PSEU|nr:WXG100 family type VII secretion target [Lentzea xinjiangensis]SEP88968.1 early secretory antigenic target ESAT-6 [Lentzea xinjiangensis]